MVLYVLIAYDLAKCISYAHSIYFKHAWTPLKILIASSLVVYALIAYHLAKCILYVLWLSMWIYYEMSVESSLESMLLFIYARLKMKPFVFVFVDVKFGYAHKTGEWWDGELLHTFVKRESFI